MDVSIIAGRRGEACVNGRIVARIGQWDARAFRGGDWEGSCECEWYKANDEAAFERLANDGVKLSLKLFDFNEALHEGTALARAAGEPKMMGDVAILELDLRGEAGSGPEERPHFF